jgi:hypothetical protein
MTYTADCHEKEHIKKKKYLCNCRDMSIFTFRTGKVIITGFENISKIQDIYSQYLEIVKAEREQIYIEPSQPKIAPPKKQRAPRGSKKKDVEVPATSNKIMHAGGRVFIVVDEF